MVKTIKVNGDEIKMKSRRVTRCGNFIGFRIKVNDKDYFVGTLHENTAMDRAYVRYIKECR